MVSAFIWQHKSVVWLLVWQLTDRNVPVDILYDILSIFYHTTCTHGKQVQVKVVHIEEDFFSLLPAWWSMFPVLLQLRRFWPRSPTASQWTAGPSGLSLISCKYPKNIINRRTERIPEFMDLHVSFIQFIYSSYSGEWYSLLSTPQYCSASVMTVIACAEHHVAVSWI